MFQDSFNQRLAEVPFDKSKPHTIRVSTRDTDMKKKMGNFIEHITDYVEYAQNGFEVNDIKLDKYVRENGDLPVNFNMKILELKNLKKSNSYSNFEN